MSLTESPSQGLYIQEDHIVPEIGFECMILFLSSPTPCDLQIARLLEWAHFLSYRKHSSSEENKFKFNKVSHLAICILSREIMEKGNCLVSPNLNRFANGKYLITS